MNVTIKEREYSYTSDYPNGWKLSSGDSYKFPVLIGNYKCFIKRFEKKRPADISGWELLNRLKGRFEHNLARVYDITSTKENNKEVYYVFYEYMKGETLDVHIAQNTHTNLRRLTTDLFSALEAIHKNDYWFAGFCEKNIFCEESGRFVLADIHSAQPVQKPRYSNVYGTGEYWAMVFAFYRDILGYDDLKPSDLSGAALDYLQVIFLILRIKMTLADRKYPYASDELFGKLPAYLNSIDPAFKHIFEKAFQDGRISRHLNWSNEIKDLIVKEIIEKDLSYDEVVEFPVIQSFQSNADEVKEGETVLFNWEVKNAESLELHRNGLLYKKLHPDEKSIEVEEAYDGKTKRVAYTLLATNGAGNTRSMPRIVTISDNVTVMHGGNKPVTRQKKPVVLQPLPPGKKEKLRRIRFVLLSVFFGIIAIASVAVYLYTSRKVEVYKLNYKIYEGFDLIIFGKNFPTDTSKIQVYFNNLKGNITAYADNYLHVTVPQMEEGFKDGEVKVAVVANGDSVYAPGKLIVKKNIEAATKENNGTSSKNNYNTDIPKEQEPAPSKRGKLVIPLKKKSKTEVAPDTLSSRPVINIPPPEPVKDKPKIINLYEFVSATPNDYHTKPFGGIAGLKVTVLNRSPYDLDNVTIEVSYLTKNESELKKSNITLKNVPAHQAATINAPDNDRGRKVKLRITSISSVQYEKDLQQQDNI